LKCNRSSSSSETRKETRDLSHQHEQFSPLDGCNPLGQKERRSSAHIQQWGCPDHYINSVNEQKHKQKRKQKMKMKTKTKPNREPTSVETKILIIPLLNFASEPSLSAWGMQE